MTVTVAVTGSRAEAELIVGMLRNHGVTAAMSADDAGGVDLALQAQGVRVLVPESQATKAGELLREKSAAERRMNRFKRMVVRVHVAVVDHLVEKLSLLLRKADPVLVGDVRHLVAAGRGAAAAAIKLVPWSS